jgi:hypothetical protein
MTSYSQATPMQVQKAPSNEHIQLAPSLLSASHNAIAPSPSLPCTAFLVPTTAYVSIHELETPTRNAVS